MYELIEHKKLDAAAASITFSNIPQIYTDLYLVTSLRTDFGGDGIIARAVLGMNSVTTGYSSRLLFGNGSSASSSSITATPGFTFFYGNGNISTANTFASTSIHIPNYTSSAAKSASIDSVTENNATSVIGAITASLSTSTEAISSLTLTQAEAGNFVQHSSATLYGINRTQAIGRPKAIGGNITYANGYWVHTFTGSGSFYAQEDLEVDALVVAGGGGAFHTGGAGAGGLLTYQGRISSGSYPVLIGSGGVGGSPNGLASNGQASSFMSVQPTGGGRSNDRDQSGSSGGSGGGGALTVGAATSGGTGTTGQGNSGGSGSYTSGSGAAAGGGGGGAGQVGGNASAGTAGKGGDGLPWNGAYYAGGGAGGNFNSSSNALPGLGGGGIPGTGGTLSAGGNGAASTGGGGGGMSYMPATGGVYGGAGGSGVVIVRYRA